jgi:CHASE1-domain containing sensor protein
MTNDQSRSGFSHISALWNRYLAVSLTLVAGIGFSVTVLFAVRWWESRDIAAVFRLAAEDRANAVKNTFEIELGMLNLVGAALMSDGRVEKDEFQEVLQPFHARDKSIEAVEWIPRVPGARRRQFETAARQNGFEGFQITETDRIGTIVPARQRDEYFPIYFCGPRPLAPGITGYDVGSEATRLESLRRARDSGKATASGRIDFIQDPAGDGGFLVTLPVYEKGRPLNTVADRRRRLMGFIMGVFRPVDMLGVALARLQPEGIDIALYDSSAPPGQRKLDFHASRIRQSDQRNPNWDVLDENQGMHYCTRLDVAGHAWTVACLPVGEFVAARRTWWPWGMFAVGLAFTAVAAAYTSMRIGHTSRLEEKVREQTADVRHAQEEVTCRLVSAAQWSDEETGMHIRRTGLLSEALARSAGWFGEDVDFLRQAAPMHDVGKIGIPDAILRKPGKLTPEEFDIMKTHTRIGADILAGSKVPMIQMARDIALCHHERWDGHGYPRGLAGTAIPEAARVVAIVDVYDALTHDRVYRPAMPESEALRLMREGAGTQFDPDLLAAFFRCLPQLRRILRDHPDEAFREPTVVASLTPTQPTVDSREPTGIVLPTPGAPPMTNIPT